MHGQLSTSFLVLGAFASLSQAQEAKIPRPLPVMQDVKTAPVPTPYMPDPPPRSIRVAAAQAGTKPPKSDSAQDASNSPPIFDFSHVLYDQPGDGATWARGRTYKMRFDAASATYIPFLGSSAPHNFPVRVELTSASVGGTELGLTEGGVVRDGDDVTIERGLLRETWHLTPDAAEESFVLAARPAAAGALRLRLALDTELEPRESAAGIELVCDRGSVAIGRAIAIDHAGRRVELASSLENGALSIDVPAELVRDAAYPLVVDPLYTSHALDTSTSNTSEPDIANSGALDYWAASYQFAYSQTDADCYTVDVHLGIPVGTVAWVDYTTNSWFVPRIAYNALHDTFLTVATVRPTPSSPGEIWCRARQAGTLNQYAQFQVQAATFGSCFYCDVGGDPVLAAPTYFMAVWTRNYSATDWDIHGRLIDWDGTPLGSGPIYIENSGAFDWYPRISKTDGRAPSATQEWNVVWMRGSSNCDIYGAQIHWDGTITNPAFAIDTASTNDTFPSASSLLDGSTGPRPWMVAFTRPFSDTDIWAEVLVGTSVQQQIDVSVAEGAAIHENQLSPDVDSNGKRFVVCYSETYNGSATDHDLYAATLHYIGGALAVDEAHASIDGSSADTLDAQVASGMTMTPGGEGYTIYGMAWQRSYFGGSTTIAYDGSYYEPSIVDAICGADGSWGACPCNSGAIDRGCPNSATNGGMLYAQGGPYVGHDTFNLTAFEMPANTTCLFFQGTSASTTGTTFGDGLRCVTGSIIRLGTKATVNGAAFYPEAGDLSISAKGLVPSDGGLRYYQVWYRNAASFCTPAVFNITIGKRVLWLR